jgi:hypothetical protein
MDLGPDRAHVVCLYLYGCIQRNSLQTIAPSGWVPYMQSGKELPAEPSSSPEEVAELLKKTGVTGLVIVGYFIPTFVLWLMIFKPF